MVGAYAADIRGSPGRTLGSAGTSMVSAGSDSPDGIACWFYFVLYYPASASCCGLDQDVWL